jgi:PAS domain S-box-containing protein
MEQGSHHFEWMHKRTDTGETFPADVLLSAMELDGKRVLQAVVRDITERKRAEEARETSEKRFRDIADHAQEWIWEVGTEGQYTYTSHVVENILGYTPEEILQRHFYDLFHPEDREALKAAAFAAFAAKKLFRGFLNRNVHKNGQTVWLSTSGIPLFDEKGHLLGYRGVDTDITEQKRAEEDLRSSQEQFRALAARIEHVREEERAALARELHDELGQGLTALQIDLAWLDGHLRTAGLADLPVLRDKIAAMVPRAERLIETTQAISSTMRPGVLDDLGLVAAIEWLAADFEKRTGLACMATLPASDIALDLGLAVVLFRIVQEALTNVIRHAKATRVEIRLRTTEGELTLEVEDNGRGITPQQIADPRSLGLFSMRERAAALGGTVDFRSGAGRGTTVSVRVPVGG